MPRALSQNLQGTHPQVEQKSSGPAMRLISTCRDNSQHSSKRISKLRGKTEGLPSQNFLSTSHAITLTLPGSRNPGKRDEYPPASLPSRIRNLLESLMLGCSLFHRTISAANLFPDLLLLTGRSPPLHRLDQSVLRGRVFGILKGCGTR